MPNSQLSPLVFDKAIRKAEQRLMVVGQNLSFLATNASMKQLIFDTLRQKSIELNLLVCDVEPDYLPQATREFTGFGFIDDLKVALKTFKSWQIQADQEKLGGLMKGRLEIRLSGHIGNISLTFLDPSLKSGLLEITPVAFNSPSPSRARFILTNSEHSEMFQAYLGVYDLLFRTGGSRSVLDIVI